MILIGGGLLGEGREGFRNHLECRRWAKLSKSVGYCEDRGEARQREVRRSCKTETWTGRRGVEFLRGAGKGGRRREGGRSGAGGRGAGDGFYLLGAMLNG